MKFFLAAPALLILVFVTLAFATSSRVERDRHGRILRSRAPIHAFRVEHPCPGGPDKGSRERCAGYKVDHIVPLCAGGHDGMPNLQWQNDEASRQKDLLEVRICRANVYIGPDAVP